VKFTLESGSLGLEVLGSPENQTIDFTVWDTGIGIATEDMGRLFRPFVQLDSSLSRQYTGTGLGLSLVSRLAEMHSGSVRVESKLGEGSRFTITLPWTATDHIQAAAPQNRQINIHRCLLVEDNELHQRQIGSYLKSLGIETIIYNHGDGAPDAAVRVHPDVILLDLNLPDVPGKEVLKKLKGDPRTAQIGVVISSVVEDRNTCLSLGAAGYLLKPFTLEEMAQELAKIVIPQQEAAVPADNLPVRGTVLLADDNPVILNTLTDFLEASNYSVFTARNGHELVELAATCDPDIILADIQMPGLDGLQAIQQIRASGDAKLSRLPIVAITALAMPGDEEKCLAAGANQYISKPVSLEKLLALISNLIEATQEV
jgi:CheY-like chemotaxis protein